MRNGLNLEAHIQVNRLNFAMIVAREESRLAMRRVSHGGYNLLK
jgi:hypothetical protein